jgi:hypothetical protein
MLAFLIIIVTNNFVFSRGAFKIAQQIAPFGTSLWQTRGELMGFIMFLIGITVVLWFYFHAVKNPPKCPRCESRDTTPVNNEKLSEMFYYLVSDVEDSYDPPVEFRCNKCGRQFLRYTPYIGGKK